MAIVINREILKNKRTDMKNAKDRHIRMKTYGMQQLAENENLSDFLFRNLMESAEGVQSAADVMQVIAPTTVRACGSNISSADIKQFMLEYGNILALNENVNMSIADTDRSDVNGLGISIALNGFNEFNKAKSEILRIAESFKQRDIAVFEANVINRNGTYDAVIDIIRHVF